MYEGQKRKNLCVAVHANVTVTYLTLIPGQQFGSEFILSGSSAVHKHRHNHRQLSHKKSSSSVTLKRCTSQGPDPTNYLGCIHSSSTNHSLGNITYTSHHAIDLSSSFHPSVSTSHERMYTHIQTHTTMTSNHYHSSSCKFPRLRSHTYSAI